MPIANESDFVVYPELFFSGVVETLQQEADVFNASSQNVIRMVTQKMAGDYEKESFFKNTLGLVNYRDPNGTGTVQDNKLSMAEVVSIKTNRRIGPVVDTIDQFKKISLDPAEFSVLYGQQWGVAVAIDYANSALNAVRAAIASVPTLQYNNTTQAIPTLNATALVSGTSIFGDRNARIKAWVMTSKTYFDLMKQSIADKVYQVAGATIYAGTVPTMGKPCVVIDSPPLTTGSTGSNATEYDVLGLTENAVTIVESEDRTIVSQLITGGENIGFRIQGEYAYNLKVKNTSFNLSSGGLNPTDAAIGTPSNWTFVMDDIKNAPGFRLTTL